MKDFQQAISGNQLTLVDFYATWCGPCKMMHPILEQLKTDMEEQISIIKVDVDEHQDLSTMYNVQSIPTLMLFRNGSILWRQTGAIPLYELKRIIQDHQ